VPWSTSGLPVFARLVGKAPSLVSFNIPFTLCRNRTCGPYTFPVHQMQELRDYGAIPILNWSSESSPLTVSEPKYRLAAIAAGHFDRYLRTFAQQVRAWGHPFFLRFDWEMNGFWFPWGELANGNHRGDFVRAWRHVHQIFRQQGATNAKWVWCPLVDNHHVLRDMAELYPGDAYVDWTCVDGYNFGRPIRSRWQTFRQIFTTPYHTILKLAPSKPMLIGEVGCGAMGGNKAAWVHAMLTRLPIDFPRLFGFVWFDAVDPRPHYRNLDIPLERPASSLVSFSSGVASSRYLSNTFATLTRLPAP